MAAELKLYQKKNKLILGSIGIAVLLVALVVMLINGPDPDSVFGPLRIPELFYTIGIAGVALTLCLLKFALTSLRHPRPRVILSAQGIIVDGFSGRFNANWADVQGYKLASASIYMLHLKDIRSFVENQPSGRPRETARGLSEKFGSPFLIETGMLDADPAAIRDFLEKHVQELKT
ncbi:hypothetical protein ACT6QG_00815 [Xanthobacter sp. TB0136]|uniref:hypothetical protein n=1 Tax=Xanthobacter sp. TB0136 TaxID=3459177 RepID=UPI0040394714